MPGPKFLGLSRHFPQLGLALVLALGALGPTPAFAKTAFAERKPSKKKSKARAKARARARAKAKAKAEAEAKAQAQAREEEELATSLDLDLEPEPEPEPSRAEIATQGPPAKTKAAKPKLKKKARASSKRPAFLKRAELGALRTLSGARAIRLSRYTSPEWSFGGSVGLASFSHREPNDQGEFRRVRFVGRLMLGAEAMHWPMKLQDPKDRRLRADLGFGTRFAFYWGFTGDDGDDDNTLDTPLELGLEFPIAVRLFVGSRIHVTPEFGLLLRYVPGSRKPDQNNDTDANPGSGVGERLGTTNGPGFGVEFGDHAGMFVGLSVGYLFGNN